MRLYSSEVKEERHHCTEVNRDDRDIEIFHGTGNFVTSPTRFSALVTQSSFKSAILFKIQDSRFEKHFIGRSDVYRRMLMCACVIVCFDKLS